MAIITVSAYTPVLGKEVEAEALLKEGLDAMRSFGAKGHVATLVLGGVQNTLSVIMEFEDAEAFGAALDKAYAHGDCQALIERGQRAQALVPAYSVEYSEVPGFEVPFREISSHGVLVLSLYKIHHGQRALVHKWMRTGKKISEKHGAKVRLFQSGASDPTGVNATAVYYPNFSSWTRHVAGLAADPDWKEYGEEVDSVPPHADFLRTTVYRVI